MLLLMGGAASVIVTITSTRTATLTSGLHSIDVVSGTHAGTVHSGNHAATIEEQ